MGTRALLIIIVWICNGMKIYSEVALFFLEIPCGRDARDRTETCQKSTENQPKIHQEPAINRTCVVLEIPQI